MYIQAYLKIKLAKKCYLKNVCLIFNELISFNLKKTSYLTKYFSKNSKTYFLYFILYYPFILSKFSKSNDKYIKTKTGQLQKS